MYITRLFVVLVLTFSVSACSSGGSAPTSPSPAEVINPIPAGPVMAPPPAGVSPEVWRVAFMAGIMLVRPDEVHIVLPDQETEALFTSVLSLVRPLIRTPIDFVASPVGATFPVTVVPELLCNGQKVGGCTSFQRDSTGRVISGRIEFSSVENMHNRALVMHEMLHTLGINQTSPVPGIMAQNPWSRLEPSDEEQKMILGRYEYPLLARYSPQ